MLRPRSSSPRATLGTVARLAGVSTATVSLILSGREDRLKAFNSKTVEKVREAAASCGYHPNLFASGVRKADSSFFALILKEPLDRERDTWHHWAFEGSLLTGVASAATAHGLYPVVLSRPHEETEDQVQQVAKLMDGGVLGSIIRTPSPLLEVYVRTRLERGHPVVVVFPRELSAWRTNALDVDNVAIGRTAGELLARGSRKRWLLVSYQHPTDAHRLRARGLLRCARESGARVRSLHLPRGVDEAGMARLLAEDASVRQADAVYAVDSVSSVSSLTACLALGRTPGHDMDLIGCDCSFRNEASALTITSVDISWREAGETAIARLADLAHAGNNRFKTILLQPRVAPGETCRAAKEAQAST